MSYDRSPLPVCSMTIGTRPSPVGSDQPEREKEKGRFGTRACRFRFVFRRGTGVEYAERRPRARDKAEQRSIVVMSEMRTFWPPPRVMRVFAPSRENRVFAAQPSQRRSPQLWLCFLILRVLNHHHHTTTTSNIIASWRQKEPSFARRVFASQQPLTLHGPTPKIRTVH